MHKGWVRLKEKREKYIKMENWNTKQWDKIQNNVIK